MPIAEDLCTQIARRLRESENDPNSNRQVRQHKRSVRNHLKQDYQTISLINVSVHILDDVPCFHPTARPFRGAQEIYASST